MTIRARTPLSIVAIAAGLLFYTAPSFAWNHGGCHQPNYSSQCDSPLGDNTYNLVSQGVTHGTNYGVNGAVNVGGVNVAVSSWSDTYSDNDDIVVGGKEFYKISDRNGYGVINKDSESKNDSPEHAIDNNLWGNYYNNYAERVKYADFDFVLFSFSEAVTMTGANFGWAQTQSDSQVSVAALSDLSLLTSGNDTWSSIAGAALAKNSFDITECDTGYTSAFDFTQSAQYWLVGAYNVAFGDITNGQTFNDAFKLTAVGFNKNSPKTPSEVSAPGTLGLFLLSGVAVALRRRQRS